MSSDLRCKVLIACAVLMLFAACVFHVLQNNGVLPGGSVAAVKTAWLFTVLFYWYVLPAIWCLDRSLPQKLRLVLTVALLNMIVRAVFELPLMYMTQSWAHAYGIGHDLFSAALSVVLLLWMCNKSEVLLPAWPLSYFIFSAVLFLVEAVFATYLRGVTGADGSVFFLPAEAAHNVMLGSTAVAVLLAWLVVYFTGRRWIAG